MITVPQSVKDIVVRSPFLEYGLSEDLINLSALARQIKPEVENRCFKKVSIGSIVMALKRLQPQLDKKHILKRVFDESPNFILRSHMFEVTVYNSESLATKQEQFIRLRERKNTYFTTITYGVFETTIIASTEIQDEIIALLKDESIISHINNLSSITITFQKDIIEIPGVYYALLKTLAWEGIDVVEFVSTYSELTIILKKRYVDRAFLSIKTLFNSQ